MPRMLLPLTVLPTLSQMAAPAFAGRAAYDPLAAAVQLRQAAKPMSAVRQPQRVAEDAQCTGQSKPIIACSCEATDYDGKCLQEVCETVCDGKDDNNG